MLPLKKGCENIRLSLKWGIAEQTVWIAKKNIIDTKEKCFSKSRNAIIQRQCNVPAQDFLKRVTVKNPTFVGEEFK